MTVLWSDDTWQVIDESVALPDGRIKTSIRVKRPDSVHILAFPAPGKILILREYRPYYQQYLWMIPSGKVDKENDITIAAQRELQEETGYKAQSLQHYCTVQNTESIVYENHVFIASKLVESRLPQDADEEIEVHELSLEEALNNVLTSPVVHTVSAFALLRYMKEQVQ